MMWKPSYCKCNKYFDAPRTHKSTRGLLVIGLISKDLRDKYKATEKLDCMRYNERMMKSFTKTHNLVHDMKQPCVLEEMEKTRADKSLVDRHLKHSYDIETLGNELLIHCFNDVELKRELKMKEYGSVQEIIERFKKIKRVREWTEQ